MLFRGLVFAVLDDPRSRARTKTTSIHEATRNKNNILRNATQKVVRVSLCNFVDWVISRIGFCMPKRKPVALSPSRRVSHMVAHLRNHWGDRVLDWKPARALPFACGLPSYGNPKATDLNKPNARWQPAMKLADSTLRQIQYPI